jgi:hypothetical protein
MKLWNSVLLFAVASKNRTISFEETPSASGTLRGSDCVFWAVASSERNNNKSTKNGWLRLIQNGFGMNWMMCVI